MVFKSRSARSLFMTLKCRVHKGKKEHYCQPLRYQPLSFLPFRAALRKDADDLRNLSDAAEAKIVDLQAQKEELLVKVEKEQGRLTGAGSDGFVPYVEPALNLSFLSLNACSF
jgi:hypothetical protein